MPGAAIGPRTARCRCWEPRSSRPSSRCAGPEANPPPTPSPRQPRKSWSIQQESLKWPAKTGRIQDWSADSRVRAFLASDQVRADKAVRAPVQAFESALRLSTPFHKYDHVCGEGFLAQTRRERRAYPSGVWKERATTSGPKRTAARRVAPHLASGFVAPRSQSAGGYAPSSRLARSQMRRNKCGRIYETGYLAVERLPGEPARTVMRGWLAGFQGAEVRSTASEVFVDSGDHNARVHGFAIRLQREVQIHGVVNRITVAVVGWR